MYKFENLIEEVKELNTELKYGLDDIVGVTIEKGLIPTVANLTQTALDKFYIVKPETFIYNPRTHGVRLGMGYNETSDTYITSWNNVAFRVKETAQNIVLPQYLWLYFCRPIWDRITNFLAWGSSTIVFAWKDFLNIDIDLPSIEKQREIVEEYETLSRRIRLNEQMIEKLEATAQALYRKMFVDGIDKENLPEGWRNGVLGEVCETQYGYTETATQQIVGPKFLRITDVVNDSIDWSKVPYCPISEKELKKYKLGLGDIVVSRTGANIGWAKQIKGDIPDSVFASFLIRIKAKDADMQWMIGHLVESSDFKAFVAANQQGSAQPQANANILVEFPLIIPDTDSLQLYNLHILPINRMLCVKEQENTKLSELQSLLLAKMGNLKQ